MKLRLSSRKSALAQAQAFTVGAFLQKRNPGLEIEYLFRESLGDKNLTDPLWKMPEKGVFTQDFLQDLVDHKTDLVVHSWKDLPTADNGKTLITATLPREDQRDLLLFKKSSRSKNQIQIFTSSPRRELNLKRFLSWALPLENPTIAFQTVRGNIQTRVQKLLEAPDVDGLILAKAALDRLFSDGHFPEVQSFLKSALKNFDWMVLPLSENPNAAAQGALAIEVAKDRKDMIELMKSINCPDSFAAAQRERDILQEFGGGCHLALGMSVLKRDYGQIEIVRGRTPKGDEISSTKFLAQKTLPKNIEIARLDFSTVRTQNGDAITPSGPNAFFISRAEAFPSKVTAQDRIFWTAGLMTWKKLAQRKIWIHGSSEGLGESEDPRLEHLSLAPLNWCRLTHDQADSTGMTTVKSYNLELKLISTQLGTAQAYIWKSGLEFKQALERFPELKNRFHICGPGRTYAKLKELLGTDQNIFIQVEQI